MNEDKPKTSTKRILLELLIYACIFVFCIFIVPRFIIQRTVVDGESMQETLQNQQSLLVQKVTKHFTDPKRYDIIIFDPPAEIKEGDSYYVKRVIGLPGETVQIKGNDILINGKKLEDETYGNGPMDEDDNETAIEPLKLGDDEFFVMGDNRKSAASEDSRAESLGPVKRDMLIGTAILRIWPLSSFGLLD